MPQPLDTFAALFEQADSTFMVYDLGRRVSPLPPATWQACEQGHQPYPYPLQQHACIGLVFWHRHQPTQPFIWFLKLPLDEQGLIKPTAMQQYLKLVIEALGRQLDAAPSDTQQERLANNPFSFKPPQLKLAYFNAHVRKQRDLPPSAYYPPARSYLSGECPLEQWQELAAQGLADVVVRLDEQANAQALAERFAMLPATVRQILSELLEHYPLPQPLAARLYQASQQATTPLARQWPLRMLAASQDTALQQHALSQVFEADAGTAQQADALVAIAGRCWDWLDDEPRLLTYLEALAHQPAPLFQQLVRDLLAIPALKPGVLAIFRRSDRSPRLSLAIGNLLMPVSASHH